MLLIVLVSCLVSAAALIATAWWLLARPQPRPVTETLFEGITYERDVRRSPRLLVIHVLMVDLRTPGLSFLVTPCEEDAELSCPARTTTEFMRDFNVQIAINGDGFTPWVANHLFDYYPRSGELVEPIGLAASQGVQYAQVTDAEPVLYISRTNQIRFNTPTGRLYNALSGNSMLVEQGQALPMPDSDPAPRSAVGLDRNGKYLILVVVDGRQPTYSQGVTLAELAKILIEKGVHTGMNLDGGGSATLAARNDLGIPALLNSPINHGIPGLQRPVANHLGIMVPSR